ncbi:CcdC protein domain-containing protein [Streptomyces fumanus]|uniref:DUF1453 domain-containing protein n=1 Tax=Streptomyces fumanus TaxID=67302 RepID=A0A919E1A3_9ACTN|nr:CcdC protein domain-containing protein [Streptomyces fumanus]GHF09445.1 DUF1453 domain-containing protein [Streptomyces fumanus]
MPGLADALVIVAVAGLVIARQFRPSRMNAERRWWIVSAVLGIAALRDPGILGPQHHAAAMGLLATALLLGLVIGAGLAWTTRIWTEADGTVWSRGSKATVAVWIVGIGVRVVLFALGSVLGVHQDASAALLALAGTLLVRSGVLAWRARTSIAVAAPVTGPVGAPVTAYGDAMARPAWKEPV